MTIDTIVLMLATFGLLIVLWGWHSSDGVRFNLTEMLIDSKTNRVSLMKCGQALALLISTWVLIHETRAGRMSEFLFLTYMGVWSGANIANKAIQRGTNEQKNGNLTPDLRQDNKE
mgnify:CR=1 FL=1